VIELENVLPKLTGLKASGSGGYMAFCPAHEDDRRSLSVNVGEDGKVLLYCHAGCSFTDIIRSLGIEWEEPQGKTQGRTPGQAYQYLDENGELLYEVIRFVPKGFAQRRPYNGTWAWGLTAGTYHLDNGGVWRKGSKANAKTADLPDVRRVLYHLPELLARKNDEVYVVEGEKDADRLMSMGLLATTNPGGAGKWESAFTESLRGRDVIIIPDNDKPGQQHAELVAKSLHRIASSVKIVPLPVKAKGDVSDFLDSHPLEDLIKICSEAPYYSPDYLPPTEADLAHAEALSTLFYGKLKWGDFAGSWYLWTGKVWKQVPEDRITASACRELRQYYGNLIANAKDTDEVNRLTKLIKDTHYHKRMESALAYLRGFPGFYADAEDFDANPWVLNCQNGILDLRTFELKDHYPSALCTKITNAKYEPGATSDFWNAHLEYFLPDPDVRRQVQRDLGIGLVGETLEENLEIWYGTGCNGKTVTQSAISWAVGDYATEAAPNLLIAKKHDSHPAELADLRGSRLVMCSEAPVTATLDEAKVKDLTGGGRQKARFMRQDFFSFQRTFSIILACNHKPSIQGSDRGIWRRVRVIPWDRSADGWDKRKPQAEVMELMRQAAPAILAWLVEGLKDWTRDPHWIAERVTVATEAYRKEQDTIMEFVSTCCEQGPNLQVPFSKLYAAYADYCAANGEDVLSKKSFGMRLNDLGFDAIRIGSGREKGRRGLRLIGEPASGTPEVPPWVYEDAESDSDSPWGGCKDGVQDRNGAYDGNRDKVSHSTGSQGHPGSDHGGANSRLGLNLGDSQSEKVLLDNNVGSNKGISGFHTVSDRPCGPIRTDSPYSPYVKQSSKEEWEDRSVRTCGKLTNADQNGIVDADRLLQTPVIGPSDTPPIPPPTSPDSGSEQDNLTRWHSVNETANSGDNSWGANRNRCALCANFVPSIQRGRSGHCQVDGRVTFADTGACGDFAGVA